MKKDPKIDWRESKRRQLKIINVAMEALQFGAAYLPCRDELEEIKGLLKACTRKMSYRNWQPEKEKTTP